MFDFREGLGFWSSFNQSIFRNLMTNNMNIHHISNINSLFLFSTALLGTNIFISSSRVQYISYSINFPSSFFNRRTTCCCPPRKVIEKQCAKSIASDKWYLSATLPLSNFIDLEIIFHLCLWLGNSGPALHPPLVLPAIKSSPAPEITAGHVASMPPTNPTSSSPESKTPPNLNVPITRPSIPPSAFQRKVPDNKAPVWAPVAPGIYLHDWLGLCCDLTRLPVETDYKPVLFLHYTVPDGTPQRKWPQIPPAMRPVLPGSLPPSAYNSKKPDNKAPVSMPIAPSTWLIRIVPSLDFQLKWLLGV